MLMMGRWCVELYSVLETVVISGEEVCCGAWYSGWCVCVTIYGMLNYIIVIYIYIYIYNIVTYITLVGPVTTMLLLHMFVTLSQCL